MLWSWPMVPCPVAEPANGWTMASTGKCEAGIEIVGCWHAMKTRMLGSMQIPLPGGTPDVQPKGCNQKEVPLLEVARALWLLLLTLGAVRQLEELVAHETLQYHG